MATTEIFQILIASISVIIALLSLVGALKSGVLKRIRFGSFELEATAQERKQAKEIVDKIKTSIKDDLPFETEQLAQYYAQILAQSKISFWFSLVFASLGFVVIILAGFLHQDGNLQATFVQVFAGVVMDAISALFFVQSKNAQKSMGEFFDKLRRDRQQLEARKLCEGISNQIGKDAIKMQLALHYAELPEAASVAQGILDSCLTKDKQAEQSTALDGNSAALHSHQ